MKERAKIELENSNGIEALKEFKNNAFDLAIVDPPYGADDCINPQSADKVYKARRGNYHEFNNVAPPPEYFEELKRVSKNQIIWGANFFGLKGGFICWNKNKTAFGDGELAYCSLMNSVRLFHYTWNGMIQQNMKHKEKRIHPTQKPVALYKWLLREYAQPGDKILDTHLGSGSIALACWDLGFDLTAFEIDPIFYEAAVKRFETHKSQLKLF